VADRTTRLSTSRRSGEAVMLSTRQQEEPGIAVHGVGNRAPRVDERDFAGRVDHYPHQSSSLFSLTRLRRRRLAARLETPPLGREPALPKAHPFES